VIQPRWLSVGEVLRLHEIQIQRYGGQPGIRDNGLLESAVMRPQHKHHYQQTESVIELAVTYAVAISGNHPFFDGNKRTAFYAMAVFLELHSLRLSAPEDEATHVMLKLAAGELSEQQLNEWVLRWV
jgi:death-on-curing protein